MATLQLFGKFGANVLGGEVEADALGIDFLTDTIKGTLHTTTWVPDIDTDEVFGDVTDEVANGNGYTTGGVTLGSKTVVYTATGNISTFSSAAASWTAAGGSIVFRYLILWRDSTTDPLIGYVDTGSTQTITDGNSVTFTPGANGWFRGTVT